MSIVLDLKFQCLTDGIDIDLRKGDNKEDGEN